MLAAKPSDRFETPCFAAGSRPLLLIQGGHTAAGCYARASAPSTAVDDASSRVKAQASRRARSWAEAGAGPFAEFASWQRSEPSMSKRSGSCADVRQAFAHPRWLG